MERNEVTRILNSIDPGDSQAADQLLPLIYEELRRLAAHKMASEPPGQTLQPTALVHEAYLRLIGSEREKWENREFFFRAAARAMRCILIDNARRKKRIRHGGGLQRVDLENLDVAIASHPDQLLAVDEILEKLAVQRKDAAELVQLRYFAGLPLSRAAELLGIPDRTAGRLWEYARGFIYRELKRMQT